MGNITHEIHPKDVEPLSNLIGSSVAVSQLYFLSRILDKLDGDVKIKKLRFTYQEMLKDQSNLAMKGFRTFIPDAIEKLLEENKGDVLHTIDAFVRECIVMGFFGSIHKVGEKEANNE